MSNSFDVDIAHIRASTAISLVLAVGAVAQALGSALLLNAGLNPQGVPLLKIMGSDVPTATVASIALCTSALWAYVAYLARPKAKGAKLDAPVTGAARHETDPGISDDFSLVPQDTARAGH